MVGMFTKKVPAIGAKAVMIGAVVLYIISIVFIEPYFRNTAIEAAMASGITDLKELSIIKANAYPHFLHIMGILFTLSVLLMLLIGKVRPKETVYDPKLTDAIDVTPWKYSIIVGIVITILVMSTYFIF